MHVDLLTLYLLAVGTLLVSAGMTFWEHRTHPQRSRELRTLSAGFATLAAGCMAVLVRQDLPAVLGSALSNLVILTGYLLVLAGIAGLCRRQYRVASFVLLIAMAATWAVGGRRWEAAVWAYVSAFPIALVHAVMAWCMWRCSAMRPISARRIVAVVAGVHAVLYAGRAFVLPWLVAQFGQAVYAAASEITIYEGVLYSVILPMALVKLVREEAHGQLLKEAQTDYLTRLGNRRWFFEEGTRIAGTEARSGPLAILAFDLDRFKAVNDLYGHEAGDKVLQCFATVAGSVLGPDTMLARIGGEEFAAMLLGPDAHRAKALGEAVVQRFAQKVAHDVSGIGIPVTVSIGLARFESKAPPLAEALAAADQALYRAKSLGGNRLEAA